MASCSRARSLACTTRSTDCLPGANTHGRDLGGCSMSLRASRRRVRLSLDHPINGGIQPPDDLSARVWHKSLPMQLRIARCSYGRMGQPDPHRSDWRFVAIAAAALTFVLPAFGAGMGFSAVCPWGNSGVSASTFQIRTGLYLICVAMLTSAIGSYIAGRFGRTTSFTPFFEGPGDCGSP
jgi:hypothetical protein